MIGRHLLIDLKTDNAILTDLDQFRDVIGEILRDVGATIISFQGHRFPAPSGVTGLFLLAESHASFHTWPEFNLACLDFFTCGRVDPEALVARLASAFPEADLSISTHHRATQGGVQ